MKTIFLAIGAWAWALLLPGPVAAQAPAALPAAPKTTPAQKLLQRLKKANDTYVLVAAHRGDWRNFPENSLEAMESAMAMGVDILEIDVQQTKDGHLVLMHDKTVDRTTTGKGKVSDYTLDSLKGLRLKNGIGRPTAYLVPTLEEAMLAARGRVLVNLDKCYEYLPQAHEVLRRTGTLSQAIFKSDKPAGEVQQHFGPILPQVVYMPVVSLDKKGGGEKMAQFAAQLHPPAMEIVFAADTSSFLPRLKHLPASGARVWVNTMWGELCAGRNDDAALRDPEAHWGWALALGATIIQTDRPEQLIAWLKKKGRRT